MKRSIGSILLGIALSLSVVMPVLAIENDSEQHSEIVIASEDMIEDSIEDSIEISNDFDNDKAFAEYVDRLFYGEPEESIEGTVAYDNLSSVDQELYDLLRPEIIKIANGERASSEIVIDTSEMSIKTTWTSAELGYKITQDKLKDIVKVAYDVDKVISALLCDMPYEMYWYDKTCGYRFYWPISYFSESASIVNITFEFYVVSTYSKSKSEYTTDIDTSKTTKPKTAVANARSVVKSYSSYDDYEKLAEYRKYICNQVTYNHDAASITWTGGYTDPWQMIYVFDNDSATNVVCEGYSKAFQYLCDQSTFADTSINSYIVYGYMNGGGHMWNVVHMDDGKNYIVDVTNCDSGSSGAPDLLFLKGVNRGSVKTGYWMINSRILYQYEEEIFDIYTEDELTLSSADYNKSSSGKLIPRFTNVPILSGIYGTKLSDLTLSKTLDISDNGVIGTWSITDSNKNSVYPAVNDDTKYQITFTPNNSDIESVSKLVIPSINAKEISLIINNANRIYGENNPRFSIMESSIGTKLVGSDTISDLNIVFNTAASETSDVGKYDITATYNNSNYRVDFENGTLTIRKATYNGNTEINADVQKINGTTKLVKLPVLPKGAEYSSVVCETDRINVEYNDKNTVLITAKNIEEIPENTIYKVTLDVTNATNYSDYFVTLKLRIKNHIHEIDRSKHHLEVPATYITTGYKEYYECANGCDNKLDQDGNPCSEEDLTIPLKSMRITFYANGGSLDNDNSTMEVVYGTYFPSLPVPQRDNYIFRGWYTSRINGTKILEGDTITFTGDTTLYAMWDAEKKRVTFPGLGYAEIPYGHTLSQEGIRIPIPNNEDSELTFGGWYTNEECSGNRFTETTVVKDALTLYPKWIKFSFKIEQEIISYPYTGGKIKAEIKSVYCDDVLLEEGIDYIISYANNVNVAVANEVDVTKAPTIIVTGKGNYSGTQKVLFDITPKNIEDEDVSVSDLASVLVNSKGYKPIPTVKWGSKKLSAKSDFNIEYYFDEECSEPVTESSALKEEGIYYVAVQGKGNYTGSVVRRFEITSGKVLASKLTVKIPKSRRFTGEEITFNDEEIKVSYKGHPLIPGEDYEVSYRNNYAAGTATFIVTGLGENYIGSKSVTFKITGTAITKAKVAGTFIKSFIYTGEPCAQEDFSLCVPDIEADEDSDYPYIDLRKCNSIDEYNSPDCDKTAYDYIVSYSKNIKVGTATMTIKGVNGYTGSMKKTFKITKYNLATGYECGDVEATLNDDEYQYSKVGVMPVPTVKFGDTELKMGQDYTVSYSNNKAINDGSSIQKMPTISIKGKGLFTGTIKIPFIITSRNFGHNMNVIASDKVYSAKAGNWTPSLTVTDGDKKLTAGKDYIVTGCEFADLPEDLEVYDGSVRARPIKMVKIGDSVESKDIVPPGTEIKVTLEGKGSYEGTKELTYRIVKYNISKAKYKVIYPDNKSSMQYNGEAIQLAESQIVFTPAKNCPDVTFSIDVDSYKNNIKNGKATVVVKGEGEYGGRITITYKIGSKPFLLNLL